VLRKSHTWITGEASSSDAQMISRGYTGGGGGGGGGRGEYGE